VLGKDCLLSTYGTVSIGPGEPAQAIHADDILYRLPRPHRDIFCNVMSALSDCTEENGATRIVAGSHDWEEYPEIRVLPEAEVDTRYPSIPAEMPKGSVCFFLGTTYHGGGATGRAPSATASRWPTARLAPPQENFTVAVAQERAAGFSRDLQGLMGWRPGHNGSLGVIYSHPRHSAGRWRSSRSSPPSLQATGRERRRRLPRAVRPHRALAREAVDGLNPSQLAATPAPGTNSIGWLVWHLAG
jgi:ectoine hydroxylase-related dioxygenase (phytanoyl-CoA dioxygenase family)